MIDLIGNWFTICASTITIFAFWEMLLPLKLKRRIAITLATSNFKKTYNKFPEYYAEAFDKIFSQKHWSLNCFLRSIVASQTILVLISLYAFWCISNYSGIDFRLILKPYIILYILVFGFIFNIIPDYFSLLQTRSFLKYFNLWRFPFKSILILLLDIFFSVLVFAIYFRIVIDFNLSVTINDLTTGQGTLYVGGHLYSWVNSTVGWVTEKMFGPSSHGVNLIKHLAELDIFKFFDNLSSVYGELTTFKFSIGFCAVFISMLSSTFLSSVCLWLFLIAGITAQILNVFGKFYRVFFLKYNGKNHPMIHLGFLTIPFWTIVIGLSHFLF